MEESLACIVSLRVLVSDQLPILAPGPRKVCSRSAHAGPNNGELSRNRRQRILPYKPLALCTAQVMGRDLGIPLWKRLPTFEL